MCADAAGAVASPARLAHARALLYRLLAEVLSYPDAEALALQSGDHLDDVERGAPLLEADVAAATSALRLAVAELDVDGAERDFVSTFGHARPQGAVPYECPYVTTNLFQESDTIADIAGFYRAFGVEPSAERQDHIVLELEFMYLLAFKEATALEHELDPSAEICRDAQRAFLGAHLGRWGVRFFDSLADETTPSHFARAARLGSALLRNEFLRFGIAPPQATSPVRLPDEVDASCPVAPGAET